MISDNLGAHAWVAGAADGRAGGFRSRLRFLPAEHQGPGLPSTGTPGRGRLDTLPSERRAPIDRAHRGPARARLPAPAAPVTGVGTCRGSGLPHWPDLDR